MQRMVKMRRGSARGKPYGAGINRRTEADKAWWRWYSKYLRSPVWSAFRARIIAKRKQCAKCGAKRNFRLHHLNYLRVGKELESDVELLCVRCHRKEQPGKQIY